MTEQAERSREFDDLLFRAIDETIRYILGDTDATIVLGYLENNGCSKEEIGQKLKFFCSTLEVLVGKNRGQMLGAACILEETIVEHLARKIGKRLLMRQPIDFIGCVEELRQYYLQNGNPLVKRTLEVKNVIK